MSVVNCKSICREVEEAEYGENLTAPVLEHLRDCAQCQRFYDERLKLRQLVASLEIVAAPADFDLRVRARIANERVGPRLGVWSGNFGLGIPSVALASLVLVIGGVFAVRIWNTPTAAVVQTGKTNTIESIPKSDSTEPGMRSDPDNQKFATTKHDDREAIQRDRQPKKRSKFTSSVASSKNSGGLATKEFSTTPPRVIRKEEAVASLDSSPIFSIETSSQPLRLSLDYSGGVSRTISFPLLSFGSERVITADNSPLVKNSAKGAW